MNLHRQRRSVTFTLIGINVTVFFLTALFPRLTNYMAISPYTLLKLGFFWTPVSYMFAHGGFTHLLYNTIFLIFVGPAVENRMGSREFLAYYLLTGILAGVFSVFAYLFVGINVPIIGASGAIYAVMLAFAAYFPRAHFLLFYILPMRAPYALILFAAIDLIAHLRGFSGVAHLTHLSGLAFGYLYFIIRLRINPIHAMRERR